MIAKHRLTHVAGGLLDSFVSRNNDVDGYWAPGVMYTETRRTGRRVELDLLAATALPAAPACAAMARVWSGYLAQALLRHGASPEEMHAATLSISFSLPPVPRRPGCIVYGQPFSCFLRLVSRDGCLVFRQAMAHCMPHEDFNGRRSARHRG